MRKITELQRIKILEILAMATALAGILLTLVHGNFYINTKNDYVFSLFSISDIWNFQVSYVSLLCYSALILVVFAALYFLDERDPQKRFYAFVQGWMLVLMAASAYEWFDGVMNWIIQSILTHQFSEAPYHFLTKRADVIFFAALFVFWVLERKKGQTKNSRPL